MNLAKTLMSGAASACNAIMSGIRRVTEWFCDKGPTYASEAEATPEARRDELHSAFRALLLATVSLPADAASTHAASTKVLTVVGESEKLLSKEVAKLLNTYVPWFAFISIWFLVIGFALIAVLRWKAIWQSVCAWRVCARRMYFASMGHLGLYTIAPPPAGFLDYVMNFFRKPTPASTGV